MVAIPLYGKNFQKSSSPEPVGWCPWSFVCIIRYLSIFKFAKMMALCWPWLILQQGQVWSFRLLNENRWNKSVVVFHMKVGGCIQVNESMTSNVCQRSRSFSDLGPGSVRLNVTSFPLKPLGWLKLYFILRLQRICQWIFYKMVKVTWPRGPPYPCMVKIFFLETSELMSFKLVYQHEVLKY